MTLRTESAATGEEPFDFRIHRHPNGTATLVDLTNGQAMHSRIGAVREATDIYADALALENDLRDERSVHVLYDVGFGIGANAVAALERLRKHPAARGRLEIYSFESKPSGLKFALANSHAFPELADWLPHLRSLRDGSSAEFRLGGVVVRWRLVVGDFRERFVEAPAPQSIFYDFYSPKAVPELWDRAIFSRLREKIGAGEGLFLTYSAATPVRLHLLAAGFFVGSGRGTAAKKETTVAGTRYEQLDAPLGRDWLRKLERSASIRSADFEDAKRMAAASRQWLASPR